MEQIDTPLLIMHGEQDLRCPVSQADELYTALKRLGKRTRLLRYPSSNHGFLKLGKPSYRVDALNEVNVWLKEHLHGE
ncbi:Prolyl oligopeptidase family protein [compost metagenome]